MDDTDVTTTTDRGEGAPASDEARRAIEAIIMVTDEPADPRLLAQLTEVSAERVEAICEELAEAYRSERRGFELVKVAGGWRFQSCADMSPYVERFVLSGQSARLSAAALETLAIVAYKQPISRAQVAAIRGVNVDGVMRTLQQRGYIAELARDPGPGQAILFGTTSTFLEKLGLNAIDELPALGEFVPGPDVLEALEQGLLVEMDGELTAESEVGSEAEPEGGATFAGAAIDEPTIDDTIDLGAHETPLDLTDDGFGAASDEPLDAMSVLADRPEGTDDRDPA